MHVLNSQLNCIATRSIHAEQKQEAVNKEPLQDDKAGARSRREVLKEFTPQHCSEKQSQKALLILRTRCQQLETELAAAHTKVMIIMNNSLRGMTQCSMTDNWVQWIVDDVVI